MIWDLETTGRVRSMFYSAAVDAPPETDPDGRKEATRRHLAENLQRLGKDRLGVTLHLADVQFKERYREELGLLEISAGWRPTTKAVEFHHGPRDGELMIVDDRLLFTRIVMPYQSGVMFALGGDLKLEPVTVQHLAYDYAGWNEAQRHWIYRFVK